MPWTGGLGRVRRRIYWKFRYAFDGVGPRWPWYFEPSLPEPYGVSAGEVILNSASWPTFMPGHRTMGRLATLDSSKAVSYTHLTLPTNREV